MIITLLFTLLSLPSPKALAVDSPVISARLQDSQGQPIAGKVVEFDASESGGDRTPVHVAVTTDSNGHFEIPEQDLGGWFSPTLDRYELCVKGLSNDDSFGLYCPVQSNSSEAEETLEQLGNLRNLTYLSLRAPRASIPMPQDHSIDLSTNGRNDDCQIKVGTREYGMAINPSHYDQMDIEHGRAWLCGTSAEHPNLQIDAVVPNMRTPVSMALSVEHEMYTSAGWGDDSEKISVTIELPYSATLSDEIEALASRWIWNRYTNETHFDLSLSTP